MVKTNKDTSDKAIDDVKSEIITTTKETLTSANAYADSVSTKVRQEAIEAVT
jgi:hypothetical protein